jgi:LysM repeat protein
MATDYEVRSGDSLSKIAAREGVTLERLLQLNPSFRSNPNLIRAGQRINLSDNASNSILNIATSAKEAGDNVSSSVMRGLTALRELADEANQSIYAGSQEFQSAVSDAYGSILETARAIPGGVADARAAWNEDIKPKLNWRIQAMPSIANAALKYIMLGDDTLVEEELPQSARAALARLIAENEDEIRESGIKNYGMYQRYGGATDIAGMNETPTNMGMDILAKIYGAVSPSNFSFNEDGSVTVDDRYNVNLSTDFLEQEAERRLERSGGNNTTGAFMANAEYYVQKARNLMASVRPDMYDYKLPSEGAEVNSAEKELTGYINRNTITAEEIQAAREGRTFIRPNDTAQKQVQGLLSFLSGISQPTQGGTRGY